MKNSKIKIVSMVFALFFAIISTLAFSRLKADEQITVVQGFKWNPTEEHCQPSILCDISGDILCTKTGRRLYHLQGTSCPLELYKLMQ